MKIPPLVFPYKIFLDEKLWLIFHIPNKRTEWFGLTDFPTCPGCDDWNAVKVLALSAPHAEMIFISSWTFFFKSFIWPAVTSLIACLILSRSTWWICLLAWPTITSATWTGPLIFPRWVTKWRDYASVCECILNWTMWVFLYIARRVCLHRSSPRSCAAWTFQLGSVRWWRHGTSPTPMTSGTWCCGSRHFWYTPYTFHLI